MSFSTEIIKPDSERFALVRIQPRKYLDTLTLVTGTTFTAPLSSSILIASVDIKVAGSSDYTSFTYTHANDVLTIIAGIDISDPDYYVVVTHNIYATGTTTRYTSGVVGGDTPPDAEWKPMLSSYPVCSQTMKDITEGVFTISNTTIDLISDDRFIENFLGTNDTFNDASVDVWVCVNDYENNKLVFSGRVNALNSNGNAVSLQVLDSFNKLNSTALFGSYGDAYVYRGSSLATYPNIGNDRKSAVLTIGQHSPFGLKDLASPSELGDSYIQTYHVTDGLKLHQDTPQTYDMTTTTLSFFVGRMLGTAISKMTFGTVSRCYKYVATGPTLYGTTTYTEYYHLNCSTFSGQIGDCLPNGLPGVDSTRMWVCYIGGHTGPDASSYNVVVFKQSNIWVTPPSSGLQSNPTMVDNSYDSYCIYRNDITGSKAFDDGGSANSGKSQYYINGFNSASSIRLESLGTLGGVPVKAVYIDFNMASLGTYFRKDDFNINELYCRFTTNNPMTHAESLRFVVEAAGLTTNTSSFTTAASDFSGEVSFAVPFERSDTYPTYLQVAQYIARSAFGILKINNSRQIEYKIIKKPADLTPIGDRDDSNILLNTFTTNVDYQDCAHTISFSNPDLRNIDTINSVGPVATTTNYKAKLLHNITSNKEYRHCLTNMSGRKNAIAGYFGEPTIQYSYRTSSIDLNSNVGDAITVTSKNVAGTSQEVTAVVTEINTGTNSSTIKLNEIRGVP